MKAWCETGLMGLALSTGEAGLVLVDTGLAELGESVVGFGFHTGLVPFGSDADCAYFSQGLDADPRGLTSSSIGTGLQRPEK